MKCWITFLWANLMLGMLIANAAQAQEIKGNYAEGQTKSAVCAACHGIAGVGIIPEQAKLAGQHSSYIYKQLLEFKAGADDPDNALRYDPVMSAQAKILTEQDMADLAVFFAAQEPSQGIADETLFERGEQLYRGGDLARNIPACTACHSPSGLGNGPARYPMVAGQYSEYIEIQLNAFKRGTRRNDVSRVMRDIAERLSADEIKAIASYMQGIRP